MPARRLLKFVMLKPDELIACQFPLFKMGTKGICGSCLTDNVTSLKIFLCPSPRGPSPKGENGTQKSSVKRIS